MQNLITNTWKIFIKNKESSYFKYWNVNNLYTWGISQSLPINCFIWVQNGSQLNEDFIKSYKEESWWRRFFWSWYSIFRKFTMTFRTIYFLCLKDWKTEKLFANLHDKSKFVIHIRDLKQSLNHGLILKKSIGSLSLIKKLG